TCTRRAPREPSRSSPSATARQSPSPRSRSTLGSGPSPRHAAFPSRTRSRSPGQPYSRQKGAKRNEHSLSEASPSAAPALDPSKVETVAAVGPQQHGMAAREDRPARQVPRDPADRGGRWVPGRVRLLRGQGPGLSGRRPEGACARVPVRGAEQAGYRYLPGTTVGPSPSATGNPGESIPRGASMSTPARQLGPLLEASQPLGAQVRDQNASWLHPGSPVLVTPAVPVHDSLRSGSARQPSGRRPGPRSGAHVQVLEVKRWARRGVGFTPTAGTCPRRSPGSPWTP